MALPFAENEAQKNNAERIEYTRRKAAGRKHPGRDRLPEDLPIEEVYVDPPGDLSDLVRIGELITNKLEIVPAKAYIKRYIRGKYVVKDNPDAGVLIAELPDEVADKSIAGPSVMAQVIVDKYAGYVFRVYANRWVCGLRPVWSAPRCYPSGMLGACTSVF